MSRKTSEISACFEKLPERLNLRLKSIEGHEQDIRSYIRQELSMSGTAEFKEEIVKQIVKVAQNNFLVSLANFISFPAALIF